MKLAENPNLPEYNIKKAIIGDVDSDIADDFRRLGIDTVSLKTARSVDYRIGYHADILACAMGHGQIMLEKSQVAAAEHLAELGVDCVFADKQIYSPYPNDVLLNAAVGDDFVICKPKTIDGGLLQHFISGGKQIIACRQGYTRCSVCFVNSHAIITADDGVAAAAESHGIDVLKISYGDVRLKGFDFGFIGGACSKISKDKLLFFGNVFDSINYPLIKAFLDKYNVEAVTLNNGPLTDIGGIIPIGY